MRHVFLAFMLADDDRLGHVEQRESGTQRRGQGQTVFHRFQFMDFLVVRPSPIAHSSSP
jgi:hypothetical protein